MKIEINVPNFSREDGLHIEWDYDFTIITQIDNTTICLKANQAGLVSLARHLLTLAQPQVPTGHHLHFDATNSLEEGSFELVIEKIP